MLYLAARWRAGLKAGPKLIAVTIDHGLRKESASEARAVARLCRKLDVPHRTLRWSGAKPKTGLQDAARRARYDLLAKEAARHGARHVLTAHTLDDQAETILFRLSRGSGLSGLAAMARETRTLRRHHRAAAARHCEGAADRNARQGAHSLCRRSVEPRSALHASALARRSCRSLAKEGLSAERLALLARRIRRAEAALAAAVTKAANDLSRGQWAPWAEGTRIEFDAAGFFRLPEEMALRLLGRAAGHAGSEGPVELAKLEALHAALRARQGGDSPLRRTLAGAMVTCGGGLIVVERAPPRRTRSGDKASGRRISALTKSEHDMGRTGGAGLK